MTRTGSFYTFTTKTIYLWRTDKIKGFGPRIANEEVTRKVRVGLTIIVCTDFLTPNSQSLWQEYLPPSGIVRYRSHESFVICFREEGWEGEESEWRSCFCHLLRTPSVYGISYAKMPHLGVACSESHFNVQESITD